MICFFEVYMKKALLVVDYIAGIGSDQGSCASYLQSHPNIVANTNHLIDFFRSHKLPIFFIRLAFDTNYTNLPQHAPKGAFLKKERKFLLGSKDVEFLPNLHYQHGDTVINKTYGDIFHGNQLLAALKQEKIEELVLTGISTNNAIANGAATAMKHDFYVVVIEDACGAASEYNHRLGLEFMQQSQQVNEVLQAVDYISKSTLSSKISY